MAAWSAISPTLMTSSRLSCAWLIVYLLRIQTGVAIIRIPRPVQHLTAYIISEIIAPRACCVWSRFWKIALAGRPRSSCSRCNRETYPRPIPMWVSLRAKSGSCRRLRSRAASNSLYVGTVAFIAFRGGFRGREDYFGLFHASGVGLMTLMTLMAQNVRARLRLHGVEVANPAYQ